MTATLESAKIDHLKEIQEMENGQRQVRLAISANFNHGNFTKLIEITLTKSR